MLNILDTNIRFLRPDVAVADVTWTRTGATFHGEDMGTRKGLMVWVMTKEAGQWAITVMHNIDLPAAP